MKHIFLLLVVFLIISGCSDEQVNTDLPIVSFDETFELTIDEPVIVVDNLAEGEADSLLIQVISIQDNRCPKDAQCIRAGEVQAKVSKVSRQQVREIDVSNRKSRWQKF